MHHFVSRRLLTLAAFLLFLQYGISPLNFFGGGRPDFLYLAVLDYAFFWSWELVPFFALAVGLLRDLVGGHLFGIETACLTATGVALAFGIPKLERDNPWVRTGVSFLFVGLTETLGVGLGSWFENSKVSPAHLTLGIFWTTLYTVALSPAFFWFTNRWFKRTAFLKQYELF